jgi:hypothetical protein
LTTELQLKHAAFIATVLAVIIVLVGVLGLISLSIQKRIKEIGIRILNRVIFLIFTLTVLMSAGRCPGEKAIMSVTFY